MTVIITPHSKRRSIEKLLTLARIKAAWMPVPSAETILQRDRERLLKDPGLEGPLNEEELGFAKELLATKARSKSRRRSFAKTRHTGLRPKSL